MYCALCLSVEATHFLNFLIPLISMNLKTTITLPNGENQLAVSCGDWSVCNAAPAFMMITVTIIGVATTLIKELLALGPTILTTIPNLCSGMDEVRRTRRCLSVFTTALSVPSALHNPDLASGGN
jgi:hypothetical protein